MSLSDHAMARLRGQWGGYENELKRIAHLPTVDYVVERFFARVEPGWIQGFDPADVEFMANIPYVHELVIQWAETKLTNLYESNTTDVLTKSILFKQLHYGDRDTLNFGSIDRNWKKRAEIVEELGRYRPWSVAHYATYNGGTQAAYPRARDLANASPGSLALFDAWLRRSPSTDRPMLFPQVLGATGEKFFIPLDDGRAIPVIFSFGLVNIVRGSKVLIDVGSGQRVHERWSIAENLGWVVQGVSEAEATQQPEACLARIAAHLDYPPEG